MIDPRIAEPSTNGALPEAIPASPVLLALIRRIVSHYEELMRRDVTDAVMLGREQHPLPEGRWNLNVEAGTWNRLP